ncbi:MAG TPA: hypothetical protein VJR89_32145 [Polyangiales bacterium]|nr:hypothetical protein [Polyangiales bacterium]
MRTWLVCVAIAFSACSEKEPSAPLTPGGGPGKVVETERRDAGMTDDEDAGVARDAATDEPRPLECVTIKALQFASGDEVPSATATSEPTDFLVTRQAATWRDGCEKPTVAVELSDGVCPNGKGHELEILLAVDAITEGQIGLGLNQIVAEGEIVPGIRVRYTRPEKLKPAGVFGTCDGVSGQITFYEAPDVTRPMNWRARYDFMLSPCDGKSNAPIMVSGYFDVRLRRTLESVCP